MYIPYLVKELRNNPIQGVDLKGFLIGNAYTDPKLETSTSFAYLLNHGLISLDEYTTLKASCPVDVWTRVQNLTAECSTPFKNLVKRFQVFNVYDVTQTNANCSIATKNAISTIKDPCAVEYATQYLNLPQVQQVIHLMSTQKWEQCSYINFMPSISAVPVYREIINNSTSPLRILLYSGDTDSAVNIVGTQKWIQELGLPITKSWRPWMDPHGELAGFIQDYDGLVFKTIRNAGRKLI